MFYRPFRAPDRPPSAKPGTIPAPIGGINSITSLAVMKPTDAIYTVNIDATTYGCRVRPGYEEYANGFAGDQVKTVMPFSGSAEDGSQDRIFVATNDGVYDVTTSTSSPTKVLDWDTKSSIAGWCVFTQYVNDGGAHVLLVTDAENGYHVYSESTGLWTQPTVTGPSGTLVFVTVWKNRVWFIEENSTDAWYLGTGVFQGTATKFNFGNKFRFGGILTALYDWTLDSGRGADDLLVSVSSAGDVVVYAGTDPSSSATFAQIGVWYIGALPVGRRVGSQFGGDLLLLSTYGLISAGDLLQGKNPFTTEGSISWKIQAFLGETMKLTREEYGWEVKLHPNLSKIIVATPKVVNEEYLQYVYDIETEAWSIWEGMPILTSEEFKGESYFGSLDRRVWTITGHLDNVTMENNSPSLIEWRGLTAYSDMGAAEVWKRLHFIRPVFISELTPQYNVQAFYDYDLGDPNGANPIGTSLWGSAVWDQSVWASSGDNRTRPPRGSSGMGKVVAVAFSGKSQAETTLVSFGIIGDSGGML